MRIREQRAVLSAVPSKKIDRAAQRFSAGVRFRRRRGPVRGPARIKTQSPAQILLQFYFVKVSRVLWPLNFPMHRPCEIALMRAIPLRRRDLDHCEPDERSARKRKVEVRN